jgi:hypothetical protein
MKKIYLPSTKAEDWRRLLADPCNQWRTGFSAKVLALCWEAADKLPHGLPKEIVDVLRTDESEPTLLVALPEHKVPLRGVSISAEI